MAETVTVRRVPRPASYTWANASFHLGQRQCGKDPGLTAYPAVYNVAVAVPRWPSLRHQVSQHGKRIGETLSLAEKASIN